MAATRLQKLLATAGVASRRASEALIVAGRVTVNGRAVMQLGAKADPVVDDVRVDGRRLGPPARRRYILLNKPRGFVTTRSDPQGRPTVLDLIGSPPEYLYPVGRLDYDSEGLVLLTNDGDLAAALSHPRHGVVKVYEAVVHGVPDAPALERLRRGVPLDGRRTAPAGAVTKRTFRAGRHREGALVELTLTEGRNRQVRRMCEAVGHPVERLTRVRIGPLADARLKPGMWRELTDAELRALRRTVGPDLAEPASSARRPADGGAPARRRTPGGPSGRPRTRQK